MAPSCTPNRPSTWTIRRTHRVVSPLVWWRISLVPSGGSICSGGAAVSCRFHRPADEPATCSRRAHADVPVWAAFARCAIHPRGAHVGLAAIVWADRRPFSSAVCLAIALRSRRCCAVCLWMLFARRWSQTAPPSVSCCSRSASIAPRWRLARSRPGITFRRASALHRRRTMQGLAQGDLVAAFIANPRPQTSSRASRDSAGGHRLARMAGRRGPGCRRRCCLRRCGRC